MMATLKGLFSLLVLSVACLSLLPLATTGSPRVARTRQAHSQYLRNRRLTDVVDRGSRPPLHMFETKTHFEEEKREQGNGGTGKAGKPINYNGGPVMTDVVNLYLIYYGQWPAGSGQALIENFIRSLSAGSNRQGEPTDPKVKNWWAINAPYYQKVNGQRKNVSRKVTIAGTVYDKYTAGKAFKGSEADTVWKVVSSKIGDGKAFPYDPHAIYMLLISPDVTVPGYCSAYCGWHTMDYLGSDAVIFSFVGHHAQCPEGCSAANVSPNGNPAIDATISTIAHEIAEAATDPDAQNGWLDSDGQENADKCSYDYGAKKTGVDSRGKKYEYNVVGMKGTRYLIQQNWDRETNKCKAQK